MAQNGTRGTGSTSWIVQRLNEVSQEAEQWPSWVRSQPLTASDITSTEASENSQPTQRASSTASDQTDLR